MSLERATALLGKLNVTLSHNLDLQDARAILEGYDVHEWLLGHESAFAELATLAAGRFQGLDEAIAHRLKSRPYGDPSENNRIGALAQLLGFNHAEFQVLTLGFTCAVSEIWCLLLQQLLADRRSDRDRLWRTLLGVDSTQLSKALGPQAALRRSGLLQSRSFKGVELPSVSRLWVSFIIAHSKSLFDHLLEPLSIKPGVGLPARLEAEDAQMAQQLLQHSDQAGVNLLLYGAAGLDKRAPLAALLQQSNRNGFVLGDLGDHLREAPAATVVAQHLLQVQNRHDEGRAVLVIEDPHAVLQRRPSDFLLKLFGLPQPASDIKPLDEWLLTQNPCTTLWAGADAASLTEECLARFVFHAPLRKARRQERRDQLQEAMASFKLSRSTQDAVLQLEDVSALQLHTAIRSSRLCAAQGRRQREQHVVHALKRSLKALGRQTGAPAKDCVTTYSLQYLNHAGRFGPSQILKALRLRPQASLCLYGPPGTGKTQFVEYMATELGQRLMIRRASDLLSKWVGESEQNIAAMFEEAANEDAILFLDEADSMLRDRHQPLQWAGHRRHAAFHFQAGIPAAGC